jgi:cysteine-rich repeat protein
MRHVYLLTTICFAGFSFAALVGACSDTPQNPPPTTVTGTGPATTSGGGGDPSDGGGGSTSDGGGTTTGMGGDPTAAGGAPAGTGGDGGSGGPPPEPECGDGIIQDELEEECDDGNDISGDGCGDGPDAGVGHCEVENGWDCGMLQPSNCTINGCDPDTATDMTAMTAIALGNPNTIVFPYCVKAKLGTVFTVGNDGSPGVGDIMLIGGIAGAGGSKVYDPKSPIQPFCAELGTNCGDGANGNCFADVSPCLKADPNAGCCFDPNNSNGNCYTGGCWNMSGLGVKPFTSNFNPGVQKGAIFVVP